MIVVGFPIAVIQKEEINGGMLMRTIFIILISLLQSFMLCAQTLVTKIGKPAGQIKIKIS